MLKVSAFAQNLYPVTYRYSSKLHAACERCWVIKGTSHLLLTNISRCKPLKRPNGRRHIYFIPFIAYNEYEDALAVIFCIARGNYIMNKMEKMQKMSKTCVRGAKAKAVARVYVFCLTVR